MKNALKNFRNNALSVVAGVAALTSTVSAQQDLPSSPEKSADLSQIKIEVNDKTVSALQELDRFEKEGITKIIYGGTQDKNLHGALAFDDKNLDGTPQESEVEWAVVTNTKEDANGYSVSALYNNDDTMFGKGTASIESSKIERNADGQLQENAKVLEQKGPESDHKTAYITFLENGEFISQSWQGANMLTQGAGQERITPIDQQQQPSQPKAPGGPGGM